MKKFTKKYIFYIVLLVGLFGLYILINNSNLSLFKASWWDDKVGQPVEDWWDAAKKPPELPFCTGNNSSFDTPGQDGRSVDCGLKEGLDQTKPLVAQNRFTTTESFPELVAAWTNFALGFLFIIAMTAIIYAGFLWVTDFGGGDNQKKALDIIKYVVFGIILILVAYPIVMTIISATS